MNGYHHLNGDHPGQPSTSTGNEIIIPQGPTNQPRVLLRKLNETDAVFQLSGVETGYANSLRRVMMADVPTICEYFYWLDEIHCHRSSSPWDYYKARLNSRWKRADSFIGIDQVLFTQNTSPVPDEMLAHRLGMVPLISRNVTDGLRYTRVSLGLCVMGSVRSARRSETSSQVERSGRGAQI